jgi:hypothetical protein
MIKIILSYLKIQSRVGRKRLRIFGLGAFARGRPVGYLLFLTITTGFTGGCKPNPPPHLLQSQRESLNRAKEVQGVLQKEANDQRKAVDEQSK